MIKLNYRHSLKTMREQLKNHNQNIEIKKESNIVIYEILEVYEETGKITKTCGFFYNANDCAEYINKKNGI